MALRLGHQHDPPQRRRADCVPHHLQNQAPLGAGQSRGAPGPEHHLGLRQQPEARHQRRSGSCNRWSPHASTRARRSSRPGGPVPGRVRAPGPGRPPRGLPPRERRTGAPREPDTRSGELRVAASGTRSTRSVRSSGTARGVGPDLVTDLARRRSGRRASASRTWPEFERNDQRSETAQRTRANRDAARSSSPRALLRSGSGAPVVPVGWSGTDTSAKRSRSSASARRGRSTLPGHRRGRTPIGSHRRRRRACADRRTPPIPSTASDAARSTPVSSPSQGPSPLRSPDTLTRTT